MEGREKILIIRLSSIGDILHCSGVPRCLRAKFPKSEIHWLVRSDFADLVQFNPHLNKTIAFKKEKGLKGWLDLLQGLSKEKYTHVYDAHNNLRSLIARPFLKAPNYLRRSKSRFKRFLLFWLKVNRFPKPYVSTSSYISPLKSWGVVDDRRGVELQLPPEVLAHAKSSLPPSSSKRIALAPATAWPKKSWPLSYWKDLVSEILTKTNYNMIVLGGPQDIFCQDLILDPERVLNFQGRVSLLESAALSSLCETLVVGDTGLLHMNEGLGRNVIGILGPTPFGYPSREESVTLEKKLWCRPCSKDGSGPCLNPHYQKCLRDISPEDVFRTLLKVVEAK